MIIIRADGNEKIGTGHVMRCLSIADGIKASDEEVLFVTADEASEELITGKGYECLVLKTDYSDMEGELEAFTDIIGDRKPTAILIDSYYVTKQYFRIVREHAKVAYIEDTCGFVEDVDLVINYNIYGESPMYCNARDALLGTGYAPIREEFRYKEYKRVKEIKKIMVTVGGSDSLNIGGQLLNAFCTDREMANYEFHFVCGALNSHYDELIAKYGNLSRFHIYRNVEKMSCLMENCDIAISAAGSTMYELSAMGKPIITFYYVENQRLISEEYVKRNAAFYGKEYCEKTFVGDIKNQIINMSANLDKVNEVAQNAYRLSDGKGAQRIAKKLCALGEQ